MGKGRPYLRVVRIKFDGHGVFGVIRSSQEDIGELDTFRIFYVLFLVAFDKAFQTYQLFRDFAKSLSFCSYLVSFRSQRLSIISQILLDFFHLVSDTKYCFALFADYSSCNKDVKRIIDSSAYVFTFSFIFAY